MQNAQTLQDIIQDGVGPSKRTSLSEDAAGRLREMILLEKLPAGTLLPERNLAEALKISRTPMREAIRLLADEGLVSYTPSRRPYVADPSPEEIHKSLRVQGALEALAGEWACKLASDEEIETVKTLNTAFIKARQTDKKLEAFRLDMAFHEAIVAASKNEMLVEIHAKMNARLWRVRFLSSQREAGLDATLKEHQMIIDALSVRDGAATSAAMKHHLETAETNIDAALKRRREATTGTKP